MAVLVMRRESRFIRVMSTKLEWSGQLFTVRTVRVRCFDVWDED